jgi:hypothetical protein
LVQQEVAFGKQLMEEMNGFLFDSIFKSSAVGAITVAPDANVVYVGMGEGYAIQYLFGDGMYKSVNGGKTWSNLASIKRMQSLLKFLLMLTLFLLLPWGILLNLIRNAVFTAQDGGNTALVLSKDEKRAPCVFVSILPT